ncbi:MoaD/ThiS family protein [Verrucomicrobiota bacterium]
MKIKVSYYGQARLVRGVEDEELDVDKDASVADVIKSLAALHGEDLAKLLLTSDGALLHSILLPVNDDIVDADAPSTLKENDNISIFPAMAGG